MSASVCFEYGGYHFFPLRRFAKGEGDFFALSKRLESDPSVGLSEYKERQKFPYSYDDFYKAATNPNYDIFCCVENGKSYVPATRFRRRASCLSITIRLNIQNARRGSFKTVC